MQDAEGKILLESPLGATIAFMLIQHKAALGIKHVTDITIFRDAYLAKTKIQLLFTIKDVPNPHNEDDVKEGGPKIRQHVDRNHEVKNVLRVHKFRVEGGKVVLQSREEL
ncbi:hypothetical protein CC86DRAFT_419772 [Ophiobolus disseminans]|uniref:Uncharacterized protein n=1 Tax=Ophiobolus disseminans TaxID=1469910 RepID=A0A6A6ZVL3_9PLEO|nr:hypothetical protein CC86DRAFT_419772 [Ophiobolus disseminans]